MKGLGGEDGGILGDIPEWLLSEDRLILANTFHLESNNTGLYA